MLPTKTLNAWRVQVEALFLGQRWCVACGTVAIGKNDPPWIVRCKKCFEDFRDTRGKGEPVMVQDLTTAGRYRKFYPSAKGIAKYCKNCGNATGKESAVYALKMSGGLRECMQCWACSKGVQSAVQGVYIPDHWLPYVDQIFPRRS